MTKEQHISNNPKQQTRTLPKNFRQIGEPGAKKIYLEDYVYTYLNKLAQPGNLYARGAILFGNTYQTASGLCLFICGAAACQTFELDLEESAFTEENWSAIYGIRDKFFPAMEIVGWFLSRMGFSVDLNDKIIRTHMDHFGGGNKVLYMIDALENEDAFYQFENYSLKKQGGYYIYYETNKEMKNYMLAEGDLDKSPEDARKSATLLRDSSVVKNYKKAMKQKKSLRQKSAPGFGPASLAGVLVMIMVVFYGARSIRQFRQAENAEAVFQQQTMEEPDAAEPSVDENRTEGKTEETSEVTTDMGSSEATTDVESSEEDNLETAADIFTQEEPDAVTESWSYIGNQYTVQQGDTLAGISMKIYQSYDYIDALAEANQLVNMDEIYPGQVLEIPPMED